MPKLRKKNTETSSKMFTFHGDRRSKAGRKVIPPKCKTVRYSRRSVPSLADVINNM